MQWRWWWSVCEASGRTATRDRPRRPRQTAEAVDPGGARGLSPSSFTAFRRFFIVEGVEAYLPRERPHLKQFRRLLLTPPYQEARTMVQTTYDLGHSAGIAEGQRRTLRLQLTKRFGTRSEQVLRRLEEWP